MYGFRLQLYFPRQIQDITGKFRLPDILKIAVDIRRVAAFLSRRSAIFSWSSQNVRNFSTSPAPPQKVELTKPRFHDISVAMRFLMIACTIDVIWSEITNFFQTLEAMNKRPGIWANQTRRNVLNEL